MTHENKVRVRTKVGRKYGKLLVLEKISVKGSTTYLCKCDCGNTKIVKSNGLSSTTKSCGCLLGKNGSDLQIEGHKFGKLRVLHRIENKTKYHGSMWLCQCDCKKTTEQFGRSLTSGHVKTCGCSHKEASQRKTPRLQGKKFHELTVIKKIDYKKFDNGTNWLCQCSCGNMRIATTNQLISKKVATKACLQCSHLLGNKHPSWNHNISMEERKSKRGNTFYIKWRNQVLRRDKRICQISGAKYRLQIHHIRSWSTHKELRYDPDNGISIREELHILFHSLYGKGHNSKEQLDEFIIRYQTGEFNERLPEKLRYSLER